METTAQLQQLKPQQSVMSHVTVTESDAEFAILNLDCNEGLESSVTKILVAIEEMDSAVTLRISRRSWNCRRWRH